MKEAISQISCSQKHLEELLLQYAMKYHNVKDQVALEREIFKKCGIGGKKDKKHRQRTPADERFSQCMAEGKGIMNHRELFAKCAKERKGANSNGQEVNN